jgi:hypothetical protein
LHQFESSQWIVLLNAERKPHDTQPDDFEEPQFDLRICHKFGRSGNVHWQLAGFSSGAAESKYSDRPTTGRTANA